MPVTFHEIVKEFEKFCFSEIEKNQPRYSKEFDNTETPLLLDYYKAQNELLKSILLKMEEYTDRDDYLLLDIEFTKVIKRVLEKFEDNYQPTSDV